MTAAAEMRGGMRLVPAVIVVVVVPLLLLLQLVPLLLLAEPAEDLVVVRQGLEHDDWDEEQEQEQERSDQSLLPDSESESSESLSLSSLSEDEDDVHGLRHDGTDVEAGTDRTGHWCDPPVGTRAPSVLRPVLDSLFVAEVDAWSPDEHTVHCLFSLDRLTLIRIFISLCRSSDARHVVLFSSMGAKAVTTGGAGSRTAATAGTSERWGLGTRSDRECLCTSCPDF